jgi:hypothetical protein
MMQRRALIIMGCLGVALVLLIALILVLCFEGAGTSTLYSQWYPTGVRKSLGTFGMFGRIGPSIEWAENGAVDLQASGYYRCGLRLRGLKSDELAGATGIWRVSSDVGDIAKAIQEYAARVGAWPSSLQRDALAVGPSPLKDVEQSPMDPWGHTYRIDQTENVCCRVGTLGRDNAPGGTAEDTDLMWEVCRGSVIYQYQ